MSSNDMMNHERYPDPTAGQAIRNIEKSRPGPLMYRIGDIVCVKNEKQGGLSMVDSCPKRKGHYVIPVPVWNRALWLIRDYDRMKEAAADAISLGGWSGGCRIHKAVYPADSTARMAIKREKYLNDVAVIDQALEKIPEEYRKGIWENIQKKDPFPLDADRGTYSRWKSRFICEVARGMHYL